MSKQKRRKYTEEFKQEAVKLVTEQNYKASEAARNLGINEGVLRRWMKQIGESRDKPSGSSNDDQVKIRALEKRVKQLEMEREILKKATAFFAKESK